MIKHSAPALVAIAAWEAAVRFGLVNANLLAPPSLVLLALADWSRGTLLTDVVASSSRVLAGFALGAGAGMAIGLTAAMSGTVRATVAPFVEVARPIPPIAWIPVAILWFGIGSPAAVFIVAIGAFFPVMTATYVGVTIVDPLYVDAAKCLGAGQRLLITDVLLRAALPTIFGGLRTAVGVAWMSVIAAELVGAQSGLGYMIQLNRLLLRTEHVIAGMLVIGLLGLAIAKAMTAAERLLLPWQHLSSRRHNNGTDSPRPGAVTEDADQAVLIRPR